MSRRRRGVARLRRGFGALLVVGGMAACGPAQAPGPRELPDLAPVADAAMTPLDASVLADLAVDASAPVDQSGPPDLVPPPDATLYRYHYEVTVTGDAGVHSCPTKPIDPGTRDAGDACVEATECKGACCKCSMNGQGFFAQACVQHKCTDAPTACAITEANVPTLCK